MGNDLIEQGSHMVGGRTFRNVPTTNNTEPQRPAYPAIRKPATGPLLTTSNVEAKRDVENMSKDDNEKMPLSAPPEALAESAEGFAKKVDKEFKSDLAVPIIKKKSGRPKKE